MKDVTPASLKTTLTRQTLTEQAYDRIADAIVQGELAPGMKLTELSLASKFGISRGPLREALRRLEGRKLVAAKPRSGVRVVALAPRDILELLEIRQSLEELACRLAVGRMTDEELDRLEKTLDLHLKDPLVGRGHFRNSADHDFHFFIVHCSRNRQLIELLCGQMFDLMRVYRYKSSAAPGRTERAFAEHREIFSALRRRDADEATALMRRHIHQSRLNLLRQEGYSDAIAIELIESYM